MGYARKMPEGMEGLQIVGKKFYKAAEGAALFSVGVHTFERMGKEANAKYKFLLRSRAEIHEQIR